MENIFKITLTLSLNAGISQIYEIKEQLKNLTLLQIMKVHNTSLPRIVAANPDLSQAENDILTRFGTSSEKVMNFKEVEKNPPTFYFELENGDGCPLITMISNTYRNLLITMHYINPEGIAYQIALVKGAVSYKHRVSQEKAISIKNFVRRTSGKRLLLFGLK